MKTIWKITERLTISKAKIGGIDSFKDRTHAENNIVELDTTYTITGFNIADDCGKQRVL